MFQKKIFLLFSIVSFIAILLFAFAFYTYSYDISKSNTETYFKETVQNVVNQLDNMINDMDTVSTQTFSDKNIQKIFFGISQSTVYQNNYFETHIDDMRIAESALQSINSSKETVSSINVFSPPMNFVAIRDIYPSDATILKVINESQWNFKYDNGSNQFYVVLPPHHDDWNDNEASAPIVFSLVRPLVPTDFAFENVATIEVQQDYNKIEQICKLNDNQSILVFDSGNNSIYPYNTSVNKKLAENLLSHPASKLFSFINPENKEKMVGCYATLQNAHWTVFLMQPQSVYNNPVNSMLLMLLFICLAIMSLTLCIIAFSARMLTRPIRQLRESIKNVSLDNTELNISINGVNEIQLLQKAFLEMVINVKHSANQLIQLKESELRSKLMALQSQINPHFLYNSLMAISAAGQEANSDKVQTMCLQLSSLFRYASTDDDSKATLGEELENIRIYLEFMKWRFEDNFLFEIKTTGNLEKISVPRLILQPIVENSFLHGFSNVAPPFSLEISCSEVGNGWYCEFSDNGGGFSDEALAKLYEQIQRLNEVLDKDVVLSGDLKTHNMALLNIYLRLRLNYGKDAIFKVKNNVLTGAHIIVGYDEK